MLECYRQWSPGQIRSFTIRDRIFGTEQFLDPFHAGAELLQRLNLPGDGDQRTLKKPDVLDDHEDGTECDLIGKEEICAEGQSNGVIERKAGHHRPLDQDAPVAAGQRLAVHIANEFVKASEHVGSCTGCSNVLFTGETFLYESIQFAERLKQGDVLLHGNGPHAVDNREHDDGTYRQHQADHQLLNAEDTKGSGEQDDVANNRDQEGGELVAQHANVTIDPLNQLPWRSRLVKRHVEAKTVGSEVFPQCIGCIPGNAATEIGSDDGNKMHKNCN